MSVNKADYSNYVTYGPKANCTLALCPAELSVYRYQPTLSGNVCFLVFFGIAMLIHIAMGIKWRTWFFVVCMAWGCLSEMIGYGGRLMLHKNPFTFHGFLTQISMSWTMLSNRLIPSINVTSVCITLGPTFFTAAIYITLYKMCVDSHHNHIALPY